MLDGTRDRDGGHIHEERVNSELNGEDNYSFVPMRFLGQNRLTQEMLPSAAPGLRELWRRND
jgi:hypothetical protein